MRMRLSIWNVWAATTSILIHLDVLLDQVKLECESSFTPFRSFLMVEEALTFIDTFLKVEIFDIFASAHLHQSMTPP